MVELTVKHSHHYKSHFSDHWPAPT